MGGQPQLILILANRIVETDNERNRQQLDDVIEQNMQVLETVRHGGRLLDGEIVYPAAPKEIENELIYLEEYWNPFAEKAKDITSLPLYVEKEEEEDAGAAAIDDIGFDDLESMMSMTIPEETVEPEPVQEETDFENSFNDLVETGSNSELPTEEEPNMEEDPFGGLGDFGSFEETEEVSSGDTEDLMSMGFEDLDVAENNDVEDPFAVEGSTTSPAANELGFGAEDPFGSQPPFEESTEPEDPVGFDTNLGGGANLGGIGIFGGSGEGVEKIVNPKVTNALDTLEQFVGDLSMANQDLIDGYTNYIKNMRNELQVILLVILVINILLILVGYVLIKNALIDPINKVGQHSKMILDGDYQQQINYHVDNEVGLIVRAINRLTTNLSNAADFVKKIAKGNLEAEYQGVDEAKETDQNTLEGALLAMRNQMKQVEEDEAQRKWSSEGLSKFVEILRADSEDMVSFSRKIISNLVQYLNANQGGMFLIDKDDETGETKLELVAAYAYGRDKYVKKEVEVGEGLVGQVYYEKRTMYMTDVPQGYVSIKSGLGDATPEAILIVPLLLNDELQGVVELASFHPFKDYEREFVERLAENIASTISNVRINTRTKALLERSQEMTEQMRAQEEEMRQNMEEMEATQEEMNRKEMDLRKLYEEAKENEEELKLQKTSMESTIAEMQRVQKELKKKDKEFEQITSAIPGALFQFYMGEGGDQGFKYVSASIKNLLGLSPSMLLEEQGGFEMKEGHDQQLANALQESATSLQPLHWKGEVKNVSGNFVLVKMVANPVRLKNGGILWSGYMEDYSEREKLEQEFTDIQKRYQLQQEDLKRRLDELGKTEKELEEFENLFDAGFAISTLMKVTTDQQGIILKANRRLEEFLGIGQEELLGKNIINFFDQQELTQESEVLSSRLGIAVAPGFETLATKAKHNILEVSSFQLKDKDSKKRTVEVSAGQFAAKGEANKFFFELKDVSSLLEAKEAAQAQKSKDYEAAVKEVESQKKLINKIVAKFEKREQELEEEIKQLKSSGKSNGSTSKEAELRILRMNNEAQKEMYEKKIQELEDQLKNQAK